MRRYTLTEKENLIRNSLDKILLNRRFYVKQSSNNVWGKDIKLFHYDKEKEEYVTETYELENWYISLPVDEKTDIYALIDCFKKTVIDYENEKAKELEDTDNYTCHQLCDWEWLESEDGHIIRNGQVALVKYAVILRDIKENNNV